MAASHSDDGYGGTHNNSEIPIPPRGSELAQQYSDFGDPAVCAAEIHALGPDSGPIDPDLAEVIEQWPILSNALRADILAKVRQAQLEARRQ